MDSLQAEQYLADLRFVLSDAAGRRLVWAIIENVSQALSASFAGEPGLTAYNEGRRSVGLRVMVDAQRVDPRAYVKMLAEAMTEKEQQAERAKRAAEEEAS